MGTPYLAEIRVVSFAFAPKGWALCNGQVLAINTNQALFSLLGTTYGGNGVTNFALPNLMGRVPVHRSSLMTQGSAGGESSHTLTVAELPAHTHALRASSDFANTNLPAGALPAAKPRGGRDIYGPAAAVTMLDPAAVAPIGGGQPHENRQPSLTMNFIIALQGIFPSHN